MEQKASKLVSISKERKRKQTIFQKEKKKREKGLTRTEHHEHIIIQGLEADTKKGVNRDELQQTVKNILTETT